MSESCNLTDAETLSLMCRRPEIYGIVNRTVSLTEPIVINKTDAPVSPERLDYLIANTNGRDTLKCLHELVLPSECAVSHIAVCHPDARAILHD